MAHAAAILAGAQLAGGIAESADLSVQSEMKRAQGESQEKFMRLQSEDTIRRGDVAASGAKNKARRTVGAQRAMQGAQGVKLGYGSAGDIEAETEMLGELEATAIKNNAWREAWGLKAEAKRVGDEYRFHSDSLRSRSNSTLLAGGLSAADTLVRGYGKKK